MSTDIKIPSDTALNGMRAGIWLAIALGMAALIILVNLAVAWRLDVYGVLRDPRGRALFSGKHQREAIYLLNQAYVPENFDALIVGASASANWHPEDLTGYRFYNESILGGDASEERVFVEQALPRGHFRLALVVLSPRITASHQLNEGLGDVKRREVYGSIFVLRGEYDFLMDRLHRNRSTTYPNGSQDLPLDWRRGVPSIPNYRDSKDYAQDEQAVADYQALIKELGERGIRIIYVANPFYEPVYEANKQFFDDYMRSTLHIMPPAPIIDFNAPEYAGFRSDPRNFDDDVHLSISGSETLSKMLNIRMHQLLGDQ